MVYKLLFGETAYPKIFWLGSVAIEIHLYQSLRHDKKLRVGPIYKYALKDFVLYVSLTKSSVSSINLRYFASSSGKAKATCATSHAVYRHAKIVNYHNTSISAEPSQLWPFTSLHSTLSVVFTCVDLSSAILISIFHFIINWLGLAQSLFTYCCPFVGAVCFGKHP